VTVVKSDLGEQKKSKLCLTHGNKKVTGVGSEKLPISDQTAVFRA
jgi:hypothetical protein